MKVHFTLNIGYPGAIQEDWFEYPECDKMTEEEKAEFLEQEWQTWAWEYIDGGWNIDKG